MSIYPRTNYEMTEDDLKEILDACKPVRAMMIGSYAPRSPQENANDAWKRLGKKMGFDWETVRPISGKGDRFFTAIPSETEDQRKQRIEREAEEKRVSDVKRIRSEILTREHELLKLCAHFGDPCIYCGVAHDDIQPGPCPARVIQS